MLPPFVITEKQIDKFVRALRSVLEACSLPLGEGGVSLARA
jgi:acetylornithine/succinyldiaminopimelate/putrescine aminotransferase